MDDEELSTKDGYDDDFINTINELRQYLFIIIVLINLIPF